MIDLANLPVATPLLGDIGLTLLQLLLFFVSLWLIFLILIQRGKGGGLTAAFGGGGGDSAFGAKAGDAFTRITIVSALVWITLCMVTIARYNPPDQDDNPFAQSDQNVVENQEDGPSMGALAPADEESAASGDAGSAESAAPAEGSTGESSEGDAGESSDP